jgi:hypothetical protein
MRALLLAAAAFAAVLGLAGPAGAKTCADIAGEGYTPRHIHATGPSCRTARRVAKVVAKDPSFGGCTVAKPSGAYYRLVVREPCKRKGYRCRNGKRLGQSGIRVRCNRGAKRFRFDLV